MPRRKARKKKLVRSFWRGLNLILAGILLLALSLLWRVHNSNNLSFPTRNLAELEAQLKKGVKPVKITIPAVNLSLDVAEAVLVNGKWQVWEGKANHLATSANPGGGGNIVIYGHNKNSVFGPIRWLTVGQEVELTNEKGKTFSYKIDQTVEVEPSEISYVSAKNVELLTLYTCSGLFDTKRFIVIARLVK